MPLDCKIYWRLVIALIVAVLGCAAARSQVDPFCQGHPDLPRLLTAGGATCAYDAATGSTTITLNRSSVIGWERFRVGPGQRIDFNFAAPGTPGGGVVVNRVEGIGPARIDGTLVSNGSVALINPGGSITVGRSGVVETAGFLASTLAATDGGAALLGGGTTTFAGAGHPVANLGTITTAGGDLTLVGSVVDNRGLLQSGGGAVRLGAGGSVTLAPTGEERLARAAGDPSGSVQNLGAVRGVTIEIAATEITNNGALDAGGGAGRVFLKVGANGRFITEQLGTVNGIVVLTGGPAEDRPPVIGGDDGDNPTGTTPAIVRQPVLRAPGSPAPAAAPAPPAIISFTGGAIAAAANSAVATPDVRAPVSTVARDRKRETAEGSPAPVAAVPLVVTRGTAILRKSRFFGLKAEASPAR